MAGCLSPAFSPPRSSAREHDGHRGGGAVDAGAVRHAGHRRLPVQASAERGAGGLRERPLQPHHLQPQRIRREEHPGVGHGDERAARLTAGGTLGTGDLGRGEDGEHHTRYPHGTRGRGGSGTIAAGPGEGLGSGLGSGQAGKWRELGSLLPSRSLPPPPGLSPAAGSLPAAAVEAVSGLKSFEESRPPTQLKSFPAARTGSETPSPWEKAGAGVQGPAVGSFPHPPPARNRAGVREDIFLGKRSLKPIYLPSARSGEGPARPPLSPPPCPSSPPPRPRPPTSGRKQWRRRRSDPSVDTPPPAPASAMGSPLLPGTSPRAASSPGEAAAARPGLAARACPVFCFSSVCVSPK